MVGFGGVVRRVAVRKVDGWVGKGGRGGRW